MIVVVVAALRSVDEQQARGGRPTNNDDLVALRSLLDWNYRLTFLPFADVEEAAAAAAAAALSLRFPGITVK